MNKKYKKIIIILSCVLLASLIALFFIISFKDELNNSDNEKIKNIQSKSEDEILKKVNSLHSENSDVIGWIKIKDTQINYPLLNKTEDDFYLNHNYKKEKEVSGSIFLDKHNNLNDVNLIFHGHNMVKTGTMFNDLLKYKEEEFYNDHKYIEFYDLENKYKYEVIAAFISKVYKKTDNVFKYYKFYGEQNEEQYNNFIKNIKALNLYNIQSTASYPNKLITLSTCEYSNKNGRMVVVAKRL